MKRQISTQYAAHTTHSAMILHDSHLPVLDAYIAYSIDKKNWPKDWKTVCFCWIGIYKRFSTGRRRCLSWRKHTLPYMSPRDGIIAAARTGCIPTPIWQTYYGLARHDRYDLPGAALRPGERRPHAEGRELEFS